MVFKKSLSALATLNFQDIVTTAFMKLVKFDIWRIKYSIARSWRLSHNLRYDIFGITHHINIHVFEDTSYFYRFLCHMQVQL